MRAEQRQGGRAKKRERDPERGTRKGGKIVGRSTCKSKKGGNNTLKEDNYNIKICGCNREVAV